MTRLTCVQPMARVCRDDCHRARCAVVAGVRPRRAERAPPAGAACRSAAARRRADRSSSTRDADSRRDGERRHDQSGRPGAGCLRREHDARNGPLTGALSLQEAIRRGLEYNLGALNLGQVVSQARGQRTVARSALLPNIVGDLTATRQQVNLAALGVRFELPRARASASRPSSARSTTVDLRARLSQTRVRSDGLEQLPGELRDARARTSSRPRTRTTSWCSPSAAPTCRPSRHARAWRRRARSWRPPTPSTGRPSSVAASGSSRRSMLAAARCRRSRSNSGSPRFRTISRSRRSTWRG